MKSAVTFILLIGLPISGYNVWKVTHPKPIFDGDVCEEITRVIDEHPEGGAINLLFSGNVTCGQRVQLRFYPVKYQEISTKGAK